MSKAMAILSAFVLVAMLALAAPCAAAEGVVSGDFDARPLGEVLEELRAQVPFSVRAEPSVLEQPVSAKLESMPLRKGLEQILGPFNYVLSVGDGGAISEVRITGLRNANAAAASAAKASDTPAAAGKPVTPESLPGEMRRAFEPVQQPGSEETGPPDPPPGQVKPLPPFEPVENETGPVHPHPETVKALPKFDPIESATGPPGP